MEEELKKERINSRKKLPAFLLSALVPGLGQLYNGQPRKLLIYTFGLLTLSIGFNLLELKPYIWTYVVLLVLLLVLRLTIAIEAALIAGRTKEFQLRKYNKWYIYLTILLAWCLAVYVGESVTQTTRYKSFRVSSDAGNPNIKAGDYVLADFDFYNSKQPEYGDLVVISTRTGSYVYRVVGLPYDTLNIENNLVKYKNKKSVATLVSTLNWKKFETEEFSETLPNGFKYRVYRNKTPFDAQKATIKNIVVPAGTYFLLGDNRDNSADSRYLGFVQRQQIQGKLLTLYFSNDFSEINKSLTE